MKIFSKYKDYYDYLTGIYGVDPKIVLDRRESDHNVFYNDEKIHVAICGIAYEGFYHKETNQCYFGEQLLKIGEEPALINDSKWYKRFLTRNARKDNDKYVQVVANDYMGKESKVSVRITPYETSSNTKENCPILLYQGIGIYRYPCLQDLNINKILPPHEIYLQLSEWLAPKDMVADNQTDKEKILSNGFDLKSSFRNVK